MDPLVALFVALNAVALLAVPRRWAPLPLLVVACYVTRTQMVPVGVATFTGVRILVAVGFIRLAVRREWIRGGINGLDALMIAWGAWMVASVVFHAQPDSPFVLRVRDLYEAWGLYLLFRVYCQSREDIQQFAAILAIVLLPLAGAMLLEKRTGVNPFAFMGGVPALSAVRNDVVRAQGPFAHAILAGTVGAGCLPLIVGLWSDRRRLAVAGIAACLAIVYASGSSGPILSLMAGVGALLLWRLRGRLRQIRWSLALAYVGLDLVMNRPAYFVISDLDLMGGSTGWHRAELIRSAIAHFGEWWLVGTDYTRHWMPSGVPASPTQADITNHYIAMGVVGGLLLMLLFIALLVKGFLNVGRAVRAAPNVRDAFIYWTVGASLFAHVMTCMSVSYYDPSVLFLYLTLGASCAALPVAVGEPAPAAPAAEPSMRPAMRFRNLRPDPFPWQ